MEIAKDKIFNIRYNAKLDKLEMEKENNLKKWCGQHKIMSIIISVTILTMGIDMVLLYQFFQVLSEL